VVGSALVEAVRQSLEPDGKATRATVPSVVDLVRGLAEGVRNNHHSGAREARARNL